MRASTINQIQGAQRYANFPSLHAVFATALFAWPDVVLLSQVSKAFPQVRVGKAEAPTLLQRLTNMSLTWAEVQATFPAQQTADAAE